MFEQNSFSLEGKIALITGGAHSIGFALGVGMAKAGATICFNSSNENSCKKGIAAYKEEGVTAYGYVADVTKESEMKELVSKIRDEVGIIDILVNNAGTVRVLLEVLKKRPLRLRRLTRSDNIKRRKLEASQITCSLLSKI